MREPLKFVVAAIAVLGLMSSACGGGGGTEPATSTQPAPSPTVDPYPHGEPLPKAELQALAAMFADSALAGGQTAPQHYKWVNDNVAVFVLFDKPAVKEASTLRYIGVSVKGSFCAESVPDRSFSHFNKLNASSYGAPA